MNFNLIKFVSISSMFTFFISFGFAQNKANPPVDSKKKIKEAIAFHDKGEYEKAIKVYDLINPSDTSYVLVLSEKALSQMYNKDYEDAIKTVEEAYRLDDGSQTNYLKNIVANCYDYLEKYDKSTALYEEIIAANPFAYNTYYNLAISYNNQNKLEEALKAAQRAVELNPVYGSAHALLGSLAIMQGYETRAIMAYTTALLVSGEQKGKGYLSILEQIANGTSVVEKEDEKEPILNNEIFAELDQIIASRAALNKNYKSKVKVEGAILKQWQVIFEKFKYKPNTNDFYMDFYGKVFERLIAEDQLVTLSYYGAAIAGVPKAVNYINNKRKKRDEFITNAATALIGKRLSSITFPEEKAVDYTVWYDDGNVVAVGNAYDNAAEQRYGTWRYYYTNGQVSSIGEIDKKGKRQGDWKFFRKNGTLLSIQHFKDDIVDGSVIFFYEDGKQKKEERTYVKDVLEGQVKTYYACGTLRYEVNFKAEKKQGVAKTYFPDGKLRETETYKDGELDGESITYFYNGQKSYVFNYNMGKRTGNYISYYDDGKLERESEYKDGELVGETKSYFSNGQLKVKGQYKDGKPTGVWEEYNYKGIKTEDQEYFTEGNNELYRERTYDADGKIFSSFLAKKSKKNKENPDVYDMLLTIEFFDKTGKSMAAYKDLDTRRQQPVKFYYPDGKLFKEGTVAEGISVGKWTEYYHSGAKLMEYNYKDGEYEGKMTTYYKSGQKYKEFDYKKGLLDGGYVQYHRNGNIIQTGWYDEGEGQGDFVDYFASGKIEEKTHYMNDNRFGYNSIYTPEGKLEYQTYRYEGEDKFVVMYDDEGNEFFFKALNLKAKDTFLLKHPNQQIRLQTLNECGYPVGVQTFFYGNGQVNIAIPFVNGEREGNATGYFLDGTTRLKAQYKYGNRHGHWKWYHPNGKVSSEGEFVSNEKHGLWKEYHDNGKLEREEEYDAHSNYEDDEVHTLRWYNYEGDLLYERKYNAYDELVSYQAEGTPLTIVEVKNGETITIEANFANGKPAVRETYVSGLIDGKRTHYYKNGQVYWEVEYKDGFAVGTSTKYYANGKKMQEAEYKNGLLHGIYKKYHANGNLAAEYIYLGDQLHGETKIYDTNGKLIRTEVYRNDVLIEVK